ncbi:MAG: TetR/AcrR family transcriptional regulator [Planctomycetota bacterium]|nr:TetR/AcrR family transcriptional regulator [Planctomycetota bacterium]
MSWETPPAAEGGGDAANLVSMAKESRPTGGRVKHGTAKAAKTSIVEAAVEFLWDHPVRELTAGELMRRTGLSRPAFYQYFRSVNDLMRTLLIDLQTEMLTVAAPWFDSDQERELAIERSLAGIIDVCVRRGPVFRAVAEAAPFDPALEKAWGEFMQRWDGAVASQIVAEQGRGLIDPDLDAVQVARSLNRLDAAMMVDEFGRRDQADPHVVLQTLHAIWTRTLYARSTSD